MADNRISLTRLPQLVQANIVKHLNRTSSDALSFTNRFLHNFMSSSDTFFDQWPQLNNLTCVQERREVVHLTQSPDKRKICAVIREYGKVATMIVLDIKRGPISRCKVNANFQPVFSPDVHPIENVGPSSTCPLHPIRSASLNPSL